MTTSTGRHKRVAFVAPRYGRSVVGGSEAVMAEAARGLAARGHEVEVLTTCATNHYTWANEYPEGATEEDGLTVRRFRTSHTFSRLVSIELERRIAAGDKISALEEVSWLNGRLRVPGLYLHLLAHASEFDAVICSPYLFWTTIYGAAVAPERTIVMPCLHDEHYAWLRLVRATLTEVAGVWFLSEPEHELGHRIAPRLSPRHGVLGAAVELPESYDPAAFRSRYALERPFVLYAGRREEGKGWFSLLRAFAAALLRHSLPFDLVTAGVGDPEIPDELTSRVIDLGYLENEELPDAFAAADALLQPSANESFSRTIMESWLAGTPVVANGAGAVVNWHCERSGGGLTYLDELELGECLAFIAEAPKSAAALAERGREYVLANYTWDKVIDRLEAMLASFDWAGRP